MTANIFSSPLSPELLAAEDDVPPERMAPDNEDKENKSTSSAPSCGQPLDHDENEPPFKPNIVTLEDFIKNNPRPPPSGAAATTVRSKPNTEHISKFFLLCDQRKIVPTITETEVATQRFTACVEFGAEQICTDDYFPSKKAARTAACKLAVERLQQQVVDDTTPGSKRKASNPDVQIPPSASDKSENWIGILQEYTQKEKMSLPVYSDSAASTPPVHFTCIVSIPDLDISSSSAEGPHTSRKAAKAAVQTLRTGGLIPAEGPIPKCRKSSLAQDYGGSTGLTQIMRDFHVSAAPSTPTPSLPQQIHELSISLGLQSPMWDVQCSVPTMGSDAPRLPLWDVAAQFSERDVKAHPRLKGPVGQVWRVYGKERAKLECCENVLGALEEVARAREKEREGSG